MYGNPQRLYVLQTGDGVVKAGITSQAGDARLRQYQANGAHVAAHFISGYVTGIEAEGDLLKRLGRIGCVIRGREWFVGVRFAQAAQIARQVAKKFANTEPRSMAHLLRVGRMNLCFSDQEIAILDSYCRLTGKPRAVACREILFEEVVGMLGGRTSHAKNFAVAAT